MNPAIAFDGTNFLIAWQDLRGSTWDIYANRISQAAVVLDGNGFAVATGRMLRKPPRLPLMARTTWSRGRNGSTPPRAIRRS